MLQLAVAEASGSSVMRSVPELNASGGHVMGSTASPTRSASGSGRSAGVRVPYAEALRTHALAWAADSSARDGTGGEVESLVKTFASCVERLRPLADRGCTLPRTAGSAAARRLGRRVRRPRDGVRGRRRRSVDSPSCRRFT